MSTIATTSQPATFSPLKRLIQHYPLVAYFVLAFVGSWLTELPVLLGKRRNLFPRVHFPEPGRSVNSSEKRSMGSR